MREIIDSKFIATGRQEKHLQSRKPGFGLSTKQNYYNLQFNKQLITREKLHSL